MIEPETGEAPTSSWMFLLLALALAGGVAVIATAVSLSHRPAQTAAVVTSPDQAAGPAGFVVEAPPTDRPLFWLPPSGDPNPTGIRLRAGDWSGRQVGSVALPCRQPCRALQSPDGQRFLVLEEPAEGELIPGVFYDSAGRRIGSIAPPWAWAAAWADDSRHLCVPHDPSGPTPAPALPTDIELVDSGGGPSRIVTSLAPPAQAGFGGWQVAACSMATDRMVLTHWGPAVTVRVVQLSTGGTLVSRDLTQDAANRLDISLDGRVAVEQMGPLGVRVLDLVSGPMRWFPGSPGAGFDVGGISSTGRLVATAGGLLEVAAGRVVWRTPDGSGAVVVAVRPGTDDVVVAYGPGNGGGRSIVHADGGHIDLPASLTA
jgi:hypothetical protein